MARREGAFYFLISIRSTGRAQPEEYSATAEEKGDGKWVQHQVLPLGPQIRWKGRDDIYGKKLRSNK